MFSAVVFTVRNSSSQVLSVERKGVNDNSVNSRLFSGFVTHHVSRWPAARLLNDTTRNRLCGEFGSCLLIRPRAPRTPCSRALLRNAAMGRRRKDPSSSATVEAAKRGDGDTSYCLVRAPRGGSSEMFRRTQPIRLAFGTRLAIGVADACATRPGSRPHAPAHPRASSSPPRNLRVPRKSRARGSVAAPPNAR